MRDAIAALESALSSLEEARGELPGDLGAELAEIIAQAQSMLGSIRDKAGEVPAD